MSQPVTPRGVNRAWGNVSTASAPGQLPLRPPTEELPTEGHGPIQKPGELITGKGQGKEARTRSKLRRPGLSRSKAGKQAGAGHGAGLEQDRSTARSSRHREDRGRGMNTLSSQRAAGLRAGQLPFLPRQVVQSVRWPAASWLRWLGCQVTNSAAGPDPRQCEPQLHPAPPSPRTNSVISAAGSRVTLLWMGFGSVVVLVGAHGRERVSSVGPRDSAWDDAAAIACRAGLEMDVEAEGRSGCTPLGEVGMAGAGGAGDSPFTCYFHASEGLGWSWCNFSCQ